MLRLKVILLQSLVRFTYGFDQLLPVQFHPLICGAFSFTVMHTSSDFLSARDHWQLSLFQGALDRYLQSLPPEKRADDFLDACVNKDTTVTAEDIHAMIGKALDKKVESKGIVRSWLDKLVRALKDYDGIICTLGKIIIA